ncbi:MAG: hypothetical protein HZB76_02135 [Chlamydiae bacterium]|nr:hypothetical protein [Chlamydiota bacterium]
MAAVAPDQSLKCGMCLEYVTLPVSHRSSLSLIERLLGKKGCIQPYCRECLLRYHNSLQGRVFLCPTCRGKMPKADQVAPDLEVTEQRNRFAKEHPQAFNIFTNPAESAARTNPEELFYMSIDHVEQVAAARYRAYQDSLKVADETIINRFMEPNDAFPNGDIEGAIRHILQIPNRDRKIKISDYLIKVCKKQKNLEALKKIFLAGCMGNIEWISAGNAFYAIIDNIYNFEHDKVAFLKSFLNDLNELPAEQRVVRKQNRVIITLISVMIDDPTGSLSALRVFDVLERQLLVLTGLGDMKSVKTHLNVFRDLFLSSDVASIQKLKTFFNFFTQKQFSEAEITEIMQYTSMLNISDEIIIEGIKIEKEKIVSLIGDLLRHDYNNFYNRIIEIFNSSYQAAETDQKAKVAKYRDYFITAWQVLNLITCDPKEPFIPEPSDITDKNLRSAVQAMQLITFRKFTEAQKLIDQVDDESKQLVILMWMQSLTKKNDWQGAFDLACQYPKLKNILLCYLGVYYIWQNETSTLESKEFVLKILNSISDLHLGDSKKMMRGLALWLDKSNLLTNIKKIHVLRTLFRLGLFSEITDGIVIVGILVSAIGMLQTSTPILNIAGYIPMIHLEQISNPTTEFSLTIASFAICLLCFFAIGKSFYRTINS